MVIRFEEKYLEELYYQSKSMRLNELHKICASLF
jgi:hypothetical protein